MIVQDPKNLLEELPKRECAVLEFGCGGRKSNPDAVGVDVRDLPGVDVVGDAYDVLAMLPAASISEISSSHFLEHVEDLPRMLVEFTRVLRPAGRLIAVVPHFANPYFYSDPTHRIFFGLYTFSYYVNDPIHRRPVPHYTEPLPLTLVRAELVFRTLLGSKRMRKRLRSLTQWLNARPRWIEFHEKNLSYLFPPYEIRFVLERDAE